ncbi:MAG: restriction endonuclease [Candidatus Bathyarchaeota archaeon]|nr:restriction endonuclease [Candidatus Bathyarchaeota archaeon]
MPTHFNGILKEIMEQYPYINLAGYIADKLQLPLDKAEALAARIEKQHLQKGMEPEQKLERILQKSDEPEQPKSRAYQLDSLSKKEVEYFTRWLLEELGFKNLQEKLRADWGVGLVAEREGEKVAILTVNCPLTHQVSDAIISIAQEEKHSCESQKATVITTAYFTEQAKAEAEKLGFEFWDIDTLGKKILELKEKADLEVQASFPKYQGSLLQSLLALEETKIFLVAPKADEKYDVHLPGVKYPLLTFQAQNGEVVRCVFRIKYNEPVTENDGEFLIGFDEDGNRSGTEDLQAYEAIIQYLEQFLE